MITEAFEDDTGRYTCVASNALGADNTSAEVYIEGEVIVKSIFDQYFCLFFQVIKHIIILESICFSFYVLSISLINVMRFIVKKKKLFVNRV